MGHIACDKYAWRFHTRLISQNREHSIPHDKTQATSKGNLPPRRKPHHPGGASVTTTTSPQTISLYIHVYVYLLCSPTILLAISGQSAKVLQATCCTQQSCSTYAGPSDARYTHSTRTSAYVWFSSTSKSRSAYDFNLQASPCWPFLPHAYVCRAGERIRNGGFPSAMACLREYSLVCGAL